MSDLKQMFVRVEKLRNKGYLGKLSWTSDELPMVLKLEVA